ncbi:MAG: hypothetical protein II988_00770 [Clostridia bacterium]|nr:hypothetical protein [Clostridia bacterium]
MKEIDNLHSGHRQRLRDKFLSSPEIMSEHELLEIILFDLLPRKNTNELAHKLLRVFGSIEGVMFAKAEQLMQVDGIGKNIATKLVTMGVWINTLTENRWKKVLDNASFSFPLVRERIVKELTDRPTENMLAYMFDENDNQVGIIKFSEGTETNIKIDYKALINGFIKGKVSGIIVAHNHPSGYTKPSEEDDAATRRLLAILALHGVEFIDHVIVGKNQAFSYFLSGRLQRIRDRSDLVTALTSTDDIGDLDNYDPSEYLRFKNAPYRDKSKKGVKK